MEVECVETKPYLDQRPGTSGLRKKVSVFKQQNYLENFTQSIFDALPENEVAGSTLLVSGDGRYFNKEAIQIIAEIAAANKIKNLWIGKDGLVSTPAASAIIREREGGVCYGGIILTASHNPGGPDEDFGIKYNTSNGGPAPASLTEKIFEKSLAIKTFYRVTGLPKIDLTAVKEYSFFQGKFNVHVINPIETWMKLMRNIFDFTLLKRFLYRPDFKFVFDGLHGVGGIYAQELFLNELELKNKCCETSGSSKTMISSCLLECDPLEDFGKKHPDPNLTYATTLVELMKPLNPDQVTEATPDFGAAGDGDCDRNMILGKGFFVTPSDSVAIITCFAQECIPYFKKLGIAGVGRSMPSSSALDRVARHLNIPCYETPTGWKYFGNLMDANKLFICGEESFGTGSNHIREKDGLWAVLCWLSILAHKNEEKNKLAGGEEKQEQLHVVSGQGNSTLIGVKDIVEEFWKKFGRNYYTRYDYENVTLEQCRQLMQHLNCYVTCATSGSGGLQTLVKELQEKTLSKPLADLLEKQFVLVLVDNFTFVDEVDKSVANNQGIRFIFENGSRIVWRESGTGSHGATIRIYIERYEKNQVKMSTQTALKELSELALQLCQIKRFCNRDAPTVIT